MSLFKRHIFLSFCCMLDIVLNCFESKFICFCNPITVFVHKTSLEGWKKQALFLSSRSWGSSIPIRKWSHLRGGPQTWVPQMEGTREKSRKTHLSHAASGISTTLMWSSESLPPSNQEQILFFRKLIFFVVFISFLSLMTGSQDADSPTQTFT